MKKANDILKDLGFRTDSATTTQEAFVSRLIKVARDGSRSTAQEIRIRDFEAAIPSSHSRSTPKISAMPQPLLIPLVRKASRSIKAATSENQLAFSFETEIEAVIEVGSVSRLESGQEKKR